MSINKAANSATTQPKSDKKIVAAWNTGDNKSFVISCASSKEGEYLVGITLQQDQNGEEVLVIIHDCPAIRNGYKCFHVDAALASFQGWFWWRPLPQKVISRRGVITLKPDWIQIPVRPIKPKTAAAEV